MSPGLWEIVNVNARQDTVCGSLVKTNAKAPESLQPGSIRGTDQGQHRAPRSPGSLVQDAETRRTQSHTPAQTRSQRTLRQNGAVRLGCRESMG